MSTHPEQPLTWRDVAQWAEIGLITPAQFEAIKQHHAALPAPSEPDRGGRLNLINVAYYFGAFIILLAYSFFVGLQWGGLGTAGQLGITLFTVGALAALGIVLRRARVELAGNLLIFAATSLVPLLVYTIQRALGAWPDMLNLEYQEYDRLVRQQWLIIEIATLVVSLLVVRITRFPLVMLLVASWGWYLSLEIVRMVLGHNSWTWDVAERGAGTAVGAVMLAAALAMQGRTKKDYSFWLYLVGSLIVITHLGSLAFEYEGLTGLAFLLVSLAGVIGSVLLQRRVLLVFGALGCYAYVSYLAFNVFDGALGFIFALASIGLFIVLSAVFYQKFMRGWIQRRFAVS